MKTNIVVPVIFGVCLLILLVERLRSDTPISDADANPPGPLSPKQEQRTFHLPVGFRMELVACEPNVIDPVAIGFDEEGRMYVAEMPGYPNGGVGTGNIQSGKIKL